MAETSADGILWSPVELRDICLIYAGICTTPPDQLQFPCTMTDLDSGSWMVSGSSVLQNGATIMSGYACDLDNLEEGSRLGIMRKSDGTLHFFVNGQDCGVAATGVPSGDAMLCLIFTH